MNQKLPNLPFFPAATEKKLKEAALLQRQSFKTQLNLNVKKLAQDYIQKHIVQDNIVKEIDKIPFPDFPSSSENSFDKTPQKPKNIDILNRIMRSYIQSKEAYLKRLEIQKKIQDVKAELEKKFEDIQILRNLSKRKSKFYAKISEKAQKVPNFSDKSPINFLKKPDQRDVYGHLEALKNTKKGKTVKISDYLEQSNAKELYEEVQNVNPSQNTLDFFREPDPMASVYKKIKESQITEQNLINIEPLQKYPKSFEKLLQRPTGKLSGPYKWGFKVKQDGRSI